MLPSRREQFRELLRESGPAVLQLLSQVRHVDATSAAAPRGRLITFRSLVPQVCDQCRADTDLMNSMLGCTASWLRHGSVPSELLAPGPFVPFGFAALSSPNLFDAAVDLLVEAVHYSHDHAEHGALIGAIVPEVVKLVPRYDAAVADDDVDAARALCRLFTETGEQYLHLLLQNSDAALAVGGAVLRGAQHAEPEVAEITFNFWYILAQEIAGGGRALGDAERSAARELFAPIYVALLDSLRVLGELPADSDTWHADQRDDFKRFRYAVGDVITDVCKARSEAIAERSLAPSRFPIPPSPPSPRGR